MLSIDLSLLPQPTVIDSLDYETILGELKLDLTAIYPEAGEILDLESEPLVRLLQASAYRELILRARVNDAARATMLAYAIGSDLEHEAARFDVARLDGEPDDRLRARTQLALEGFSTAGPRLSYIFHAMSASQEVLDVHVHSPAPGEVRVVVLANPSESNAGGLPGPALLDLVDNALNKDDVRPLCDKVTVSAATILNYTVHASLICLPGPDAAVVLASAQSACQQYVDTQFRLGADITISGLHGALHQPGVMRVDLAQPAGNLTVEDDQAALCAGILLTIAGTGE